MTEKKPIEYAKMACDAIMDFYTPEDLPPKNMLFYIQGVFLSGMERLYKETGDEKYFNYIKGYVDSLIGENGELPGIAHEYKFKNSCDFTRLGLQFLDCKQPSILFYTLYDKTGDTKYLNAIKTVAESMYFWPVNRFGGYWHMLTQPDQMWMDGAYMAGPLSVMYSERFGDETLRERAINQIIIMNEHMRDEKTGLYYHGWDDSKQAPWADKETGLSSQFWGRAVGWYAVTVLDILDHIPKNHPKAERLKNIERDLLESLVRYQHKDTKMWYEVLDKPYESDNWAEGSCTNLFIYSYAKAMRLGIIEKEKYAGIAESAFKASVESNYIDENGRFIVDNTCEGTCIDEGDYKHYISRRKRKNDLHGCGAFVLMCIEMQRYRDM